MFFRYFALGKVVIVFPVKVSTASRVKLNPILSCFNHAPYQQGLKYADCHPCTGVNIPPLKKVVSSK